MSQKIIALCMAALLFGPLSHAESIFQQYKMPPIERAAKDDVQIQGFLKRARALQRAQTVSVSLDDIADPKAYTAQLLDKIQTQLPPLNIDQSTCHVLEKNQLSSQLQAKINALQALTEQVCIILNMQTIEVDRSLRMPANTHIIGRHVIFQAKAGFSDAVFYFGAKSQNSSIQAVNINTPNLAILLDKTQQIQLHDITAQASRALAVLDSQYVEVSGLRIDKPSQGGILVQGDSHHLWLHHNQVSAGTRMDNGGAGILLTDAKHQSHVEAMTSGRALSEAIAPPSSSPHAIVLEFNQFNDNLAQGVYLDGAYGVVLRYNHIQNNDKEGLCLDFAAANNVIVNNTIQANGQRAKQSDAMLEHDLVLSYGRMKDGSAKSKLPGISLDNAAQNLIAWNTVRDNAGDGIKIVRSGFRNFILFNSITDNNQGQNDKFHFFGILLGTAGLEAELSHLDIQKHPIDFLPSIENMIVGNSLYGQHYSAILLDHEAAFNDIYDNAAGIISIRL